MSYFFFILIALSLYSYSKRINTYFFKNENDLLINLFIFTFFFCLIYLIVSYSFIIGFNNKNVAYFILLVLIGIFFLEINQIKSLIKNLQLKFISSDLKIIYIILFFFFLISLQPVADEDSLRYHLEIGKKINDKTFYENIWFDYILIGAHEFINSFSLNFNLENISSLTNFLYLFFSIVTNIYILKRYKTGSGLKSGLILLSCPYLIALVSSQKFYFLPCFVVSYSIAYLFLEKQLNKKVCYLIIISNIFCVVIKPTFFPYLILIFCWFFVTQKSLKNKILLIFLSLFFGLVFYFPIFYIKSKIFSDPFIPYFSINSDNYLWYSEFNAYLRGFALDISDKVDNPIYKLVLLPLKLILPLQFSDIFRVLGVSILFVFTIRYEYHKKIIFLIIFFIISVLVLNNYSIRWFLPLIIFITIFANIDKNLILKKILIIQLFFVCSVLVPMGVFILSSKIGIVHKNLILEKIFPSHLLISDINKNYPNQKIFTNLNYFYYFDNDVPVYFPKIVEKFDPDYFRRNEIDTKLILWPDVTSEDDSINSFVERNLKCKNLTRVKKYESIGIGRFFALHDKNSIDFILYKIDC